MRRALWSAWRWRIGRAEQLKWITQRPPLFAQENALTRCFQVRSFGVANVWIDEETAAARRASAHPKPKKKRRRLDPEGKKTEEKKRVVTERELKGERGAKRLWRDGTPRPPGKEGRIRMLDSGRLIGRYRIHLVNKYGKPKRIPRKIRMAQLQKRRQERILEKKMEIDPELREKVNKAKEPTDTGAARRLREKRMDFQRMNKMEKRREGEEKAAAAYFSTPLKTEEKKVMTLFGEIDVTAAKKYRELKVARRKLLLASAEQPLQIEAGVQAETSLGKGENAEVTESQDNEAVERLRKRALKLQHEEKIRVKLLSSRVANEKVLELDDPAKIRVRAQQMIEDGQKLLKMVPDTRGDESKLVKDQDDGLTGIYCTERTTGRGRRMTEVRSETKLSEEASETNVEEAVKATVRFTEPAESQAQDSNNQTEQSKRLESCTPPSAKVEVSLVDDEFEDETKKWTWSLDSTRPIDDTSEGAKLAKVLGVTALLGFPRLTKAKKTRPSPKRRDTPEEDDLVLSPQADAAEEKANLPKFYQPEERALSLERQVIDKTLEEYQQILQSDLNAPRTKPWIRRVMKIDKDDITSKRYETPEERKATGTVDRGALSATARFKLIQPSRELMRYIDTQLLGKRRLDEWRKAGYNVKLHAPLDNVPFHKGEEKHRIHQSVFRNPQEFVAAAKVTSSLPPAELPEVAFVGRTNAGKSKLINALTRRYGTARTSPVPGKTDSVNFYVLGAKLCLVDTPGYSFMYGKQENVEALRQLTRDYITVRDELKRICLLIDAEWGVRQKDEEFIDFLESTNRNYQIVLTKTDKVLPLDLGRRVTQVQEVIKDCKHHVSPVMMVSALSGAGIGKLRMSIASML